MDVPLYVVCDRCGFLRGFGRRASGDDPPERCPACGNQLTPHGRQERFPSAYVGRTSRQLHATPPPPPAALGPRLPRRRVTVCRRRPRSETRTCTRRTSTTTQRAI